LAVYPRFSGGQPDGKTAKKPFYPRMFDFAPDEACLSSGVAAAEVGSYPAFSPLPDHLTAKKLIKKNGVYRF